MPTLAEIRCPRCDGRGGRSTWRPKQGVCYRCKGVGTVVIDVERYEAALRHLRAKYVALRQTLRTQRGDVEYTEHALAACVARGQAVKATIEAARRSLSRPR